jgi:hypothetical protein
VDKGLARLLTGQGSTQVHRPRADQCGVQAAMRSEPEFKGKPRKKKSKTTSTVRNPRMSGAARKLQAEPTRRSSNTETFFSPALRAVATSVPGAFFFVLRVDARLCLAELYLYLTSQTPNLGLCSLALSPSPSPAGGRGEMECALARDEGDCALSPCPSPAGGRGEMECALARDEEIGGLA